MLKFDSTAWKVSKYGAFSGPYFPVFGLNTEILRIQCEYRKMRTRKKLSRKLITVLFTQCRELKKTHASK